jgi:hypothetical protein
MSTTEHLGTADKFSNLPSGKPSGTRYLVLEEARVYEFNGTT